MENKELDINKDELIRFICNESDVIYVNFDISNDGRETIYIRLKNNIVFEPNKHNDGNTYMWVTKDDGHDKEFAREFVTLDNSQYNILRDKFLYDGNSLERELKAMIRGKKLDNVISEDKQTE